MNISKILKFGIAGVVAGFATSVVTADENAELQARLDAAEAKIASLVNSMEETDMDKTRTAEMQELVRDVLRDADSRSSFLGDSRSPITVNVHGFIQSRWSINDTKTVGVDETHGFNVPRTRLIVSGDIYNWDYMVSGQWDDGGAFNLKDAYMGVGGFRFGQFKAPFMSEVLGAQTDTLAAERSVISNQFGQGRSQGMQYTAYLGRAAFSGAYTDGFNTDNGAGVQNGYALTGRVDFAVAQYWDVGAAVSHNNLDTWDYNTWTVDTTFGAGGFDITGSYVATMDDTNGDDWGTVWSVAYTSGKWQPFVRYELGHLEGVTDDLSIATFGVNYSFNDHIKWTTDYGYSFNGIDGGWDLGNSGWNTTASDGEYLLRTQIQVTF